MAQPQSQQDTSLNPTDNRQHDALPQSYKLTKEEVQALRECNRESLWKRSVPFAAVLGAATHLAVKNGIIRSHHRWGSTFKVMGAGLLGYVLGKFSYRSTCEEKFLRIPGSRLGEYFRQKRGLTLDHALSDTATGSSDLEGYDVNQFYSDLNEKKADIDIDPDKNISYSGLDDMNRPTFDANSPYTEQESVKKAPSLTYDELRQQNRLEYEQHRADYLKKPPPSTSTPSSLPKRELPRQNSQPGSFTNSYGDVIER